MEERGRRGGHAAFSVRSADVLDVIINLKGGELERADLLQYPLHKDTPNVPVRLFNPDGDDLYVLQSGLTGAAGEAAPNHLATWTSAESSYVLPAGAQEIRVPLSWTDGHGLTVTKTFTFKRGSYAVDLAYDLQNDGGAARSVAAYSQILRHWVHASRSYFDVETYSFKGPAVYDGTKARDLKVENEADTKFSETVTNGWIASLQHHFVSAIVPEASQSAKLQLQVQGQQYLLSATGPMIAIPAGGKARIEEKLFMGPKLQAQLAAAGPRLDLTADYGLLTVLAHPLFVTLKWIHGLIGNWGWAIIIVTALIKLLFYPLSQASGRSMAKMRAIAHETDSGIVQGRPGEARPRNDGVVQEGKDQSVGGLPTYGGPDPVLHLILLGAARERRNAPGALHAVGQRSVRARSVLRTAVVHGRRDVCAVQIESGASRPDASQDHAVHAAGHDRYDGMVSIRLGAVLVDQHRSVHRPTVAREPGGSGRGKQTAIVRIAGSLRGENS